MVYYKKVEMVLCARYEVIVKMASWGPEIFVTCAVQSMDDRPFMLG
jgi:hypothetical protein